MPPDPFEPPPDEYEDALGDAETAAADQSRDAGARDTTESATDPKKMARKKQRQKYLEQVKAAAWRQMMTTAPGRAALWEHLAADCHILETRFCAEAGFPDIHATMFQAGQHSVGEIMWQRLLVIDFELFHTMLKENHPAFMKAAGR